MDLFSERLADFDWHHYFSGSLNLIAIIISIANFGLDLLPFRYFASDEEIFLFHFVIRATNFVFGEGLIYLWRSLRSSVS